mmetsp:Transcript_25700/g.59923  ORF Transcript_25700/g.59923 Transcript_25700/m.59923 type:complete len:222 (-) Transcript_25700:824-1489(-)
MRLDENEGAVLQATIYFLRRLGLFSLHRLLRKGLVFVCLLLEGLLVILIRLFSGSGLRRGDSSFLHHLSCNVCCYSPRGVRLLLLLLSGRLHNHIADNALYILIFCARRLRCSVLGSQVEGWDRGRTSSSRGKMSSRRRLGWRRGAALHTCCFLSSRIICTSRSASLCSRGWSASASRLAAHDLLLLSARRWLRSCSCAPCCLLRRSRRRRCDSFICCRMI